MSMKQRASFYFLFPSPLLVGPCRFFFLLHPQSSLPWQMAKGQIGSTSHGRRMFSEKDGQLRIQTSTLTSFLSSAFYHYSPIQTSRRCTKRERHHQLTAQRKDRRIIIEDKVKKGTPPLCQLNYLSSFLFTSTRFQP